MKASLIPVEIYKEMVASPSIDEALAALRDTPYLEVIKSKTPSFIQSGILEVFFDRARRIEKYAPKEALPLVQAFYREEEAKDALVIMRTVYEGRSELPILPTGSIQGTLAFKVKKEPEVLVSLQRLVELFDRTWFKPYAREAQRLAGELRSSEIFSWYPLVVSIILYSTALDKVSKRSRRGVERVLCPYLQYKIAGSLSNAKALDLPVRQLDRIYGDLDICGFKWSVFRTAYEREPGVSELLVALRDYMPKLGIDPKKPYQQALEEARKIALKQSLSNSIAAFNGYPFDPALIAASLMLAKIEAFDLTTILTSMSLRLSFDEYKDLIINL